MVDVSDAMAEFVRERHLASLTLVRGDGRPHVTPVGFTWDPDTGLARVITWNGSVKAKLLERDAGFQVTGNTGLVIPFDSGENSMTYFASAGVSYELTDWLFPTAEVNYFRVVDEGNGGARFMRQAGGAVPALATFEGGDLVNLGASNAGTNADLVTLGLGFRIRAAENIDIGAAFEFPLTDDSDNLMENRFTLDFVWRF